MDVGLARVSTRDQNPALQITALERASCDAIYEEKVSGVSTQRPVRDRILAELQPGDTLTVWKLDRLGRSVKELHEIVMDLDRRGVRFRCLTQPIDTSSATGRLFFMLLAAFAEFEREIMQERVMAGKERQRAEGRPMGPLPFGWTDAATMHPAQAKLLNEAARRILDAHEPTSRVVDDWNARDLRPGKAQRWRVTHLRRLLLNPRTADIIGQDRYDRLVRLFAQPDRHRLGRVAEHLLSGILRCGRPDCGQPMYAATKGGKGQPAQLVYRCKKRTGSGGRFNGCGSTVISLARADAWAAEAFVAAVVEEEFRDALNQRLTELLASDTTAEQLDDWRAELADIKQVAGTRFYDEAMRRRRDELERLVREATARLMAQPDLQAMIDLPESEAALRALWATEPDGTPAPGSWSVAERRAWLRRILHDVTVLPADAHHRGSDVEARPRLAHVDPNSSSRRLPANLTAHARMLRKPS
jgi:DNA invertase Pin-like site-specific DNA recombinase